MTIKQYAFHAHAHLRTQGFASITRSQVHELLAAASGFSTHAAFQHQAAWCDVAWCNTGLLPDRDRVIQRCLHFGMSSGDAEGTAQGLASFLSTSGYAPIRFEDLITALARYENEWEDDDEGDEMDSAVIAEWVSSNLISRMQQGLDVLLGELPLLLEGLEAAAARGVAAAHLATAYMLEPFAELPEEDDHRFGRELRWRGEWSTEPVGYAEIAAGAGGFVQVIAKHRYHLLAAARGGIRSAILLTAERYGDPALLELDPSDDMDPYEMADLADAHSRPDLAYQWLTVLAREGDVSAMRELIEERNETPFRAWVWMHLSRMLGSDLSQNRYEAINEDGSEYDDDVGGPAYVGGTEGIRLVPLAPEENRRAREEADQLLVKIKEHDELN